MNISSAIIKVKLGFEDTVLTTVKKIEGCEVHLNQNNKIIITIEAEDVNGEIAIVKTIEQINNVLSVEIVYAYSEEELEKERHKVDFAEETPEWLNNNNVDARQIKYGGDLKRKV